MELFEEIRLGHAAGETIQGLATKHGIHRRMVRQAISAAIPPDAEETSERPAETRPSQRSDRADTAAGSGSAAKTTTHGAPDLGAAERRASRTPGRRADRPAICRTTEAGAGPERTGSVRTAELRTGTGRAGRLVRGRGETGWRAAHATVLRDAEHGVRRRVPPGLYQCDATGIPRSS